MNLKNKINLTTWIGIDYTLKITTIDRIVDSDARVASERNAIVEHIVFRYVCSVCFSIQVLNENHNHNHSIKRTHFGFDLLDILRLNRKIKIPLNL